MWRQKLRSDFNVNVNWQNQDADVELKARWKYIFVMSSTEVRQPLEEMQDSGDDNQEGSCRPKDNGGLYYTVWDSLACLNA